MRKLPAKLLWGRLTGARSHRGLVPARMRARRHEMTQHWSGYPVPPMRATGAAHRPRGALLLRRPARGLLRDVRAQRGGACRARRGGLRSRRWSYAATEAEAALPPAWRRGGHHRRRPRADVHRQPAGIRLRAARRAAPGRDRGAGGRARAAPQAGLHRRPVRPKAIVFDAELADAFPMPPKRLRWGCVSWWAALGAGSLAALAADAAASPRPRWRRPAGRRGLHPLHLGHHRPPQRARC